MISGFRYLSVCSGIEAATCAWHQLGWTPVGFSEVDPFASAVLAHHFPNTPNFGDMTQHEQWPLEPNSIDLLVGGTPCQSFSVAGLRQGLKDPRGNLMLTFLAIAEHFKPKWILWENVPGVLSSNNGKDFGSFLGGLGELGYGFAYRVLDAQWCRTHRHPRAVPQRRRRVFVVGCAGDHISAAKVLFKSESLSRYSASRRAPREGATADAVEGSATGQPVVGQWWDGRDTAATLSCTSAPCDARMPDKGNFGAVLQPVDIVRSSAFGGYESDHGAGGTLRQSAGGNGGGSETLVVGTDCYNGAHAAVLAYPIQDGRGINKNQNGLGIGRPGDDIHAVVFAQNQIGEVRTGEIANTINTNSNASGRNTPMIAIKAPTLTATNDPSRSRQSSEITQQVAAVHDSPMIVRRLTVTECERLMGFCDGWTLIPYRGKPADQCPDGPRYKALGNSMAVNCMEWIGERIAAIESCSKVPERIQTG